MLPVAQSRTREYERPDEISSKIGAHGRETIVAGDINVKSHIWGSGQQDKHGDIWAGVCAARNLVSLGDGSIPTFSARGRESVIDVTLATPNAARNIAAWEVLI